MFEVQVEKYLFIFEFDASMEKWTVLCETDTKEVYWSNCEEFLDQWRLHITHPVHYDIVHAMLTKPMYSKHVVVLPNMIQLHIHIELLNTTLILYLAKQSDTEYRRCNYVKHLEQRVLSLERELHRDDRVFAKVLVENRLTHFVVNREEDMSVMDKALQRFWMVVKELYLYRNMSGGYDIPSKYVIPYSIIIRLTFEDVYSFIRHCFHNSEQPNVPMFNFIQHVMSAHGYDMRVSDDYSEFSIRAFPYLYHTPLYSFYYTSDIETYLRTVKELTSEHFKVYSVLPMEQNQLEVNKTIVSTKYCQASETDYQKWQQDISHIKL